VNLHMEVCRAQRQQHILLLLVTNNTFHNKVC
jgi:hypothetical protein